MNCISAVQMFRMIAIVPNQTKNMWNNELLLERLHHSFRHPSTFPSQFHSKTVPSKSHCSRFRESDQLPFIFCLSCSTHQNECLHWANVDRNGASEHLHSTAKVKNSRVRKVHCLSDKERLLEVHKDIFNLAIDKGHPKWPAAVNNINVAKAFM